MSHYHPINPPLLDSINLYATIPVGYFMKLELGRRLRLRIECKDLSVNDFNSFSSAKADTPTITNTSRQQ